MSKPTKIFVAIIILLISVSSFYSENVKYKGISFEKSYIEHSEWNKGSKTEHQVEQGTEKEENEGTTKLKETDWLDCMVRKAKNSESNFYGTVLILVDILFVLAALVMVVGILNFREGKGFFVFSFNKAGEYQDNRSVADESNVSHYN